MEGVKPKNYLTRAYWSPIMNGSIMESYGRSNTTSHKIRVRFSFERNGDFSLKLIS